MFDLGQDGCVSLHAIVGLDRTASEVMALMSRGGSQSQGQQQQPPVALPAAAGGVIQRAGGPPAALPPPSRFSVFGKNLTNNATVPGPEVNSANLLKLWGETFSPAGLGRPSLPEFAPISAPHSPPAVFGLDVLFISPAGRHIVPRAYSNDVASSCSIGQRGQQVIRLQCC